MELGLTFNLIIFIVIWLINFDAFLKKDEHKEFLSKICYLIATVCSTILILRELNLITF